MDFDKLMQWMEFAKNIKQTTFGTVFLIKLLLTNL